MIMLIFLKVLKFTLSKDGGCFCITVIFLREQQNMSVILVAHSVIEKYSPPDGDAYDRYNFNIDKYASAVIREWADIIGFYNMEVIIKKEDQGFGKKTGKALNVDGNRILNMQSTSPAWIAGNSFNLPDCIVTMEEAPDVMRYVLGIEEQKSENKKTKKGE